MNDFLWLFNNLCRYFASVNKSPDECIFARRLDNPNNKIISNRYLTKFFNRFH